MSRRPLSAHAIEMLRAIAAAQPPYWTPNDRWVKLRVVDRFGAFDFTLDGMISCAAIRALDARGLVAFPGGSVRWARRLTSAGRAWLDANLKPAPISSPKVTTCLIDEADKTYRGGWAIAARAHLRRAKK